MNVERGLISEYPPARGEIVLAALPSIVALALYYSLAIHMRVSLGQWPTEIGERGFSPQLVLHAQLEMYYFTALIWFGMFVFPIALLLCCLIRRLSRFAVLLGVSAGFFLISCVLRLFAPAAFQTWWID